MSAKQHTRERAFWRLLALLCALLALDLAILGTAVVGDSSTIALAGLIFLGLSL